MTKSVELCLTKNLETEGGTSMEWIRFILGIAFIIMGLLVFVIQLIGVYKFK